MKLNIFNVSGDLTFLASSEHELSEKFFNQMKLNSKYMHQHHHIQETKIILEYYINFLAFDEIFLHV